MKFRLARHTSDLQRITSFYCDLLDFEILGEFQDHDGYDGIFIGLRDADWHFEFTTSESAQLNKTGADDLLIFYTGSDSEMEHFSEKFKVAGIEREIPKNPYWQAHGFMYMDSDGYRIIISKPTS